jgi:hypothetical protein
MANERLTAAELLDENTHRGAVAQGNPATVELANERPASADLGHKRRLAETHFTHALTETRIPCELAHPAHRTSRQLAERKQGFETSGGHFFHGKTVELRLGFSVAARKRLDDREAIRAAKELRMISGDGV